MHWCNSKGKQFSFKQTTHIHLMFLHEADNLMLLHRIDESPDVPTIYYHKSVGEEKALPLWSRFFWLRVLTLLLADTSNEGALLEFPAIAKLPRLTSKRLFQAGEGLRASPALRYATNGATLGGEETWTSSAHEGTTNGWGLRGEIGQTVPTHIGEERVTGVLTSNPVLETATSFPLRLQPDFLLDLRLGFTVTQPSVVAWSASEIVATPEATGMSWSWDWPCTCEEEGYPGERAGDPID
jgi:hypothetical protein